MGVVDITGTQRVLMSTAQVCNHLGNLLSMKAAGRFILTIAFAEQVLFCIRTGKILLNPGQKSLNESLQSSSVITR